MRRDVFQAIADPTRREIMDLLSGSPRSMNSLAASFSISRPAISKHVHILYECGLVDIVADGRERICYIQPGQLQLVADWVEGYREFWTKKLNNLESFLKKDHSK